MATTSNFDALDDGAPEAAAPAANSVMRSPAEKPKKTGRPGTHRNIFFDAELDTAMDEYCYLAKQRTGKRFSYQELVDTAVRQLLKL